MGKVLDVEVLSKHCPACKAHCELDESSEEFLDWWEEHQAFCQANYCGSSTSMECHGALNIWKHSISLHKLRYTSMIADGDAKSFKLLSDEKP